ncbi:MAG: ATPase P [Bryobacteraceae bacterium]
MAKPGILVEIPGMGRRSITTVVSDYTGTFSLGGVIAPDVRSKLTSLAALVDLHIVTADSFGTAVRELAGIATPYLLQTGRHDTEKSDYVGRFDLTHVAAIGNGNNDRLMLQAVKEGGGLALAVDNGEGCAVDALLHSNLVVVGAANVLDLLLDPVRLKATLRF